MKAENVRNLVMIRSSSEDDVINERNIQQEQQVEAAVDMIEPNTCLICKEHLLEGKVLINACPQHV